LGLATWEFTNENEKPNSLVNSPVAKFSNPGVELLKHWELTNEFGFSFSLVNSQVAKLSNPGVEPLKHWEFTNENTKLKFIGKFPRNQLITTFPKRKFRICNLESDKPAKRGTPKTIKDKERCARRERAYRFAF
jgi:hypothetical protein